MNTLYIIDLIGTCVFAISGAQTAKEKQMDVFGISAVGFITAVGGGTLRDLLIGSTPVGWMKDLNYIILIIVGITVAMVFRKLVRRLRKAFFLFDTIGIAVFTVLGVEKTLSLGLHPVISIMMGIVSAVFGGVLRDIVCNEIPLIFRKEVYALTCLAGGALLVILNYIAFPSNLSIITAVLSIVILRSAAVKYNWQLTSRNLQE